MKNYNGNLSVTDNGSKCLNWNITIYDISYLTGVFNLTENHCRYFPYDESL